MSVAQTRRAGQRIKRQYGSPYKGKTVAERKELKAKKSR